MGEAVYAIDDFPDDDLLWRIEWIGGVGYNTSVPGMAQPPAGETNPLSARFFTVANNVGDSVALNLAFNSSAVAWQHLNLLGEYDFSDEKLRDSIGIRPPKLVD